MKQSDMTFVQEHMNWTENGSDAKMQTVPRPVEFPVACVDMAAILHL
jgi:hypothetical protein